MSLKVNDSAKKKIEKALQKKMLKLHSLIVQNSPVFTGQYRSLWSVEDGETPLQKKIVNPQGEKGRALEFGGEPGEFPPVDELRKWVRRKNLDDNENTVDQVAYLVGRKISEEGVEPQPHVRPAIQQWKNTET